MKIHARRATESANGRSKCPICGKCFKAGVYYLKLHMRRHLELKPTIEATAFEMLGQANAEKRCVCKMCDATFNRIVKLRKHIRSHGATDPQLKTRIDADEKLCDLYQITNSSGWELTLSDSETDADDSGGEDVDDDMRTMGNSLKANALHRMHVCGSCNRSFDRRYRLIVHMNFEHAKTKLTDFDQFRCNACNQPYPNEETLAKHKRDQCQNARKRFNCKECGVRFEWSTSLDLHMSKSHRDQSTQCDCCGKHFRRMQDYTRHKKTHAKGHVKKKKKAPTIIGPDGKPVVRPKPRYDTFIYPREFISDDYRRVGDSKGRRGGLIKLVTCDICKKDFSRKDNLK